ncbi:uncharacterized protein LOC142605797 [Castanea sativa]|uniref:uncharacterized protein LOC142605797 n=1 Tax=Castanea sativa TaxID=21020 RepID=UPI003F653A92
MVNKMFKDQTREIVEVCIDDMVVKRRKIGEHIPNLIEVFEILRQHKLRLNASKCALGMGSGKYLGGQVEATNKTIVNGLKKRLEGARGNWTKELQSVLWAYQTTLGRSTRETPFSMTYGAEAVTLVEISLSSMRVANFSLSSNDVQMAMKLDLSEERRDMASIRLANYQQKLARGYNRNMRPMEFIVGDLVLQRAVGSMKN